MNQQQSIFDDNFEQQTPPLRRNIMPKWLTIYMWCIIGLSTAFLIWSVYFAPDYNANDPAALDPQTGDSYRSGAKIGQQIPGILFFLMGVLVWLERKIAIRFNLIVAIFWTLLMIIMTLISGIMGLTIGIMMPVFIPYWIGLFQIKQKWEKEAVAGKLF